MLSTNTRLHLLTLGLAATAFACGGLTVNHPKVKAVQSAAIIGFGASLQMQESGSKTGAMGLANAISSAAKSGNVREKREEQAAAAYDLLVTRLNEDMQWTVHSRDQIRDNESYRTLYGKTTGEWLDSFFADWNKNMWAPGVIPDGLVQQFDAATRNKVLEDLGVDAIILARIIYKTGDTSGVKIGGIGKVVQHPEAQVELIVWDGKSVEPIWHDAKAVGEPASNGVADTMGFSDDSKLGESLIEAATSGFAELITRFRKHEKEAAAAAAEAAAEGAAQPEAAPAES